MITFLHTFVNIFAGGRSTSKVFAFIGYVLVLTLLARFAHKIRVPRMLQKEHTRVLLVGIFILFALSTTILALFLHRYGFSLRDFVISFNNGEVSSTSLAHNHVAKGFIALVLTCFGFHKFEAIDAGHAYLGLVSTPLLVLFGVILSGVLIYTLVTFLMCYRQATTKVLFVMLYAMLSFSVIERTFDGGFFDPRTPLIVLLLSVLICGVQVLTRWTVGGTLLLSLGLLLTFKRVGLIVDDESFARIVLSYAGSVGLFVIPLIVMHVKHLTNRMKWLLVVLAVTLIVPFFLEANPMRDYRAIPLSENSSHIALYETHRELDLLTQFGDLKVYNVKPGTFKTAGDEIDSYGVLDNLLPVAIPWYTCMPTSRNISYHFTLSTKVPLTVRTFSNNYVQVRFEPVTHLHANLIQYDTIFTLKPCVPRHLNIIEETMHGLGLGTFFISNITPTQYDRP